MPDLPQFEHPKLKALADAVAGISSFTGADGLLLQRTPRGWQFSLAPGYSPSLATRRTVVLVGVDEDIPFPDAGDVLSPLKLLAREVRYKGSPPIPPDVQEGGTPARLAAQGIEVGYTYATGSFPVYPAIGMSVSDYSDSVIAEGDELTRDTTFYTAWLDGDVWVLDRPSTGSLAMEWGYVVSVAQASPDRLLVQFLQRSEDEDTQPPTVIWSDKGSPKVCRVPPNFAGIDMTKLVRPTFTLRTPIIRCLQKGSAWYVEFVPRWAYRDLPADAAITRCT